MPNYQRADVSGGTYFLTVVTERQASILATDAARGMPRAAVAAVRGKRPFDVAAAVVLPDHVHMLWTLPPVDADFAPRWAAIKAGFSRAYVAAGGVEQPLGPCHRPRPLPARVAGVEFPPPPAREPLPAPIGAANATARRPPHHVSTWPATRTVRFTAP